MLTNSKIVIVPLKPAPKTKDVNYLMVEKLLFNSDYYQLEFPSGLQEIKESAEEAAKRILLQETGNDSSWVKFLYSFFLDPQNTNDKVIVFMGLVLKENESDHSIVELDGDNILKKIKENEIVDMTTLASFSAILLQSNEAKRYLEGIGNAEIQQKSTAQQELFSQEEV